MLNRACNIIFNYRLVRPTSRMADYENWSKTQLIERIRELDQERNTGVTENGKNVKSEMPPLKKAKKQFDFSKHPKRFIALRFAYLGWNYNGLSFQYEPTPLPTVEEKILEAMERAKLISIADPAHCKFSRCGRTDKGVSAMNQVVSLEVRSNLSIEDQRNKNLDIKELPYVSILNSILPDDIRITAISLRPPSDFDARFSCLLRHYRYFFKKDGLDLNLMKEGAQKYMGVHDFRNFCKIDGSKQITNYNREILHSDIIPSENNDFYIFDLKGSAFLWHQVRSMVAILFMIGQKLEPTKVIDDLLDVEKHPSKPNYEMANDIPLVLYDCEYPEMEWFTDEDLPENNKSLKHYSNFNKVSLDYQLKSNIVEVMHKHFIKPIMFKHVPGAGAINIGDGKGRNFRKYVPVCDRESGESFAVVNARHRNKKAKASLVPSKPISN